MNPRVGGREEQGGCHRWGGSIGRCSSSSFLLVLGLSYTSCRCCLPLARAGHTCCSVPALRQPLPLLFLSCPILLSKQGLHDEQPRHRGATRGEISAMSWHEMCSCGLRTHEAAHAVYGITAFTAVRIAMGAATHNGEWSNHPAPSNSARR